MVRTSQQYHGENKSAISWWEQVSNIMVRTSQQYHDENTCSHHDIADLFSPWYCWLVLTMILLTCSHYDIADLFSLWYCWQICSLGVQQENHSLTILYVYVCSNITSSVYGKSLIQLPIWPIKEMMHVMNFYKYENFIQSIQQLW
jgi:hypothetical protein